MALLHATVRIAAQAGIEVVALHVHHGLSTQADAWLDLVSTQVGRWAEAGAPVRLLWRRLALSPRAGESVEAVAREARHRALAEMAREAGCDAVLLAHHRRDQAETFLLQALRGAGVAGLAAMARSRHHLGVTWLRPWLGQPRERIERYVAQHGLPYVDDDSNADTRFARNRLRLQVWPALQGAFGDAEQVLAGAAARQADALECLDDWVTWRLASVTRQVESPAGTVRLGLVVAAWAACTPGQARTLLRAWFSQVAGCSLPASWVSRLHGEALAGVARRWALALPMQGPGPALEGEVVLYRGLMTWRPGPAARPWARPAASRADDADDDGWRLCIERLGPVPLPSGWGVLCVQAATTGGVPLASLRDCEIRPRRGGERFQAGIGRPARSLKKQYQMLGVPSWAREGPLVWAEGRLVFVPGLGMDARAWAAPGEPQVRLEWTPPLGEPPA